jgi:hypothetical protein
MFENAINSKKQGDIGLSLAIAWFSINGYTISIPLTDSQDYDLVVDKDKLYKIQVKTSRCQKNSGIYQVQLSTTGGNRSWTGISKHFNPNNVDAVFILCENSDMYLIPSKQILCKATITVGNKYREFKVTFV